MAVAPQGRDNPGSHNHSAVHRHFLNCHRCTDPEGFFQNFPVKMAFLRMEQPKLGIVDAAAPGHGETDHRAGQGRSHTGSQNAKAWNQNRVENHIQKTHHRIQDTGVTISPLHCKKEDDRELSWEKEASGQTRKSTAWRLFVCPVLHQATREADR